MKKVIVIPARYGSTRFPGKPLKMLAGKPMLQHVVELAQKAASHHTNTDVVVTSDDQRILDFAETLNVKTVLTGECPTGSDRVMAAVQQLSEKPDVIVNMQGDAPLTPPHFIDALLTAFTQHEHTQVATVATKLSWDALDKLRTQKKDSPFSGTTVVVDGHGRGMWFSKNILPAIRKEEAERGAGDVSPVRRHIGLYGYRYQALQQFLTWPEGVYEVQEGLEQLRFLENGVQIQVQDVDYGALPQMSGVDTPEDLARAEQLLKASA